MRHRLPTLGAWVALCAIAATLFALPRVWSSRFVVGRRTALHLTRARAHLGSRELPRARTEFRSALRLQPESGAARSELAAMELGLGNWELAFLEMESLTELHPDDAQSFLGLAMLMVKRGWLEAPEALLDRALEAAPQRADVHALRAELRVRLGRYHGAGVDAKAALASSPEGSDTAQRAQRTLQQIALRTGGLPPAGGEVDAPAPAAPQRARAGAQIEVGGLGAWMREAWPGRLGELREKLDAQLRQKDWTGAKRLVDAARLQYPDSVFAPYLAGILELARDDADGAERFLSEALTAAPRNPTVVAALARAWSQKKSAAFAGEKLLQLAERDRSFDLARYLSARAYVEARDPIHAESALKRGLELQPDSPVPYQHLADYYFGLDRTPEALDICAQGLGRFPGNVALGLMLAQISASLGRIGDAARAYETVLSARPDLDIIAYRLAMLLASQDKDVALWRRAVQILGDLHDDKPSDPMLVDVLGWLYYRAGDARRARELLTAAVKDVPEEPRPHFHLASVYAHEQKRDLARKELDAALGSGRPFAERLEVLRMLRDEPGSRTGANAAIAPAGTHR